MMAVALSGMACRPCVLPGQNDTPCLCLSTAGKSEKLHLKILLTEKMLPFNDNDNGNGDDDIERG